MHYARNITQKCKVVHVTVYYTEIAPDQTPSGQCIFVDKLSQTTDISNHPPLFET